MKLFEQVRGKKPGLNKFDLSHERKMSFNMGDLVPMYVQEVVPGDRFRVNSEIFCRLAPMLFPVMHRINVWTHYFFVPNRLIWSEWEDFITGGRLGTTSPVPPFTTSNDAAFSLPDAALATNMLQNGSLADYLGIPQIPDTLVSYTDQLNFSVLPFRAYQLIWDEYYRDQNLQASLDVSIQSGEIGAGSELVKLLTLRKRAWEKDYFTSALPWAQRGPEVNMPLDGTGTVVYSPTSAFMETDGDAVTAGNHALAFGTPNQLGFGPSGGGITGTARIENIESVLLESSGVTINDLRRSVRLQEWLEKNARGGARYIEQILSHFGVISSDARLQRPEYLGGGKAPVQISEVLQTSEEGATPLGEMGGHGYATGKTNGFKRRFEEHGYVIGVMSVLPRTAYQQGLPRHYSRFNKLDYYWPEFAQIGEQVVANQEIYYNGNDPNATSIGAFGYQSRYCEYKYGQSSVHGDMRDELAFTHMGRIFATPPALNTDFVTSDPTHRIFAVDDPAVQKLYAYLYNKVDALRPMPYFGTPTL